MSYQVIARKWRPQTFEDVVGQGATAQTLRNAVLQNRIAHAYLFAGARGVGKTTTARIFAKALNCAHGPTATPCNACDSCKEITNGNSIDVLEIDAASNRGIDEIRELRENVKYAAARDRFKVFIIDEVHMLTTEAFNALLKTLEEPPPQVVFVLATTELHKVPATILSRCQHFNFRAISYREILDRLQHISREEQVRISEEALNAIARGSEGSMRDAQSLLDQVISFCGNEVEDEAVRNLLGVIPQQILEEFTEAIVQSDSKRLLLQVEQLVQSGRNLQHFVREMLSHFRNLLMIKIAGEDSQLVPLAAADLVRLKEFAEHFSEEDLTRSFSILVSTEGELRWSSQPRFHLEMGLMKLIQVKRLTPIEQVLAGLEGLTNSAKVSGNAALQAEGTPRRVLRGTPALEASQPTKPPILSKSTTFGRPQSSPELPPARPSEDPVGALKSAIANRSPMLASLIEHALEIKLTENGIEMQFAGQDKFHCEMLQAAENVEVIRELAQSVRGGPQQVKIVIVNGPPRQDRSKSEPDNQDPPANSLLDKVKDDSNVKAFLQIFQGEITDVKDLKK